MTRALDYFDPAYETDNDLSRAMAKARCEFLVLSFSTTGALHRPARKNW